MAIPAGRWSSYGDVASLVGTHPVPLGVHLASTPIPGAHRVLQGGGTISSGFRWTDADDERDPRVVLEEEGVHFGANGAADESARLSTAELAERIGLVVDEATTDPSLTGRSTVNSRARTRPPS